MKCESCQYHTKDGRCLYFCGCPYKDKHVFVQSEMKVINIGDTIIFNKEKSNELK